MINNMRIPDISGSQKKSFIETKSGGALIKAIHGMEQSKSSGDSLAFEAYKREMSLKLQESEFDRKKEMYDFVEKKDKEIAKLRESIPENYKLDMAENYMKRAAQLRKSGDIKGARQQETNAAMILGTPIAELYKRYSYRDLSEEDRGFAGMSIAGIPDSIIEKRAGVPEPDTRGKLKKDIDVILEQRGAGILTTEQVRKAIHELVDPVTMPELQKEVNDDIRNNPKFSDKEKAHLLTRTTPAKETVDPSETASKTKDDAIYRFDETTQSFKASPSYSRLTEEERDNYAFYEMNVRSQIAAGDKSISEFDPNADYSMTTQQEKVAGWTESLTARNAELPEDARETPEQIRIKAVEYALNGGPPSLKDQHFIPPAITYVKIPKYKGMLQQEGRLFAAIGTAFTEKQAAQLAAYVDTFVFEEGHKGFKNQTDEERLQDGADLSLLAGYFLTGVQGSDEITDRYTFSISQIANEIGEIQKIFPNVQHETGFMSGNIENVAAYFGKVMDPEKRKFATKVGLVMNAIIRLQSGAQIAEWEKQNFEQLWAKITNSTTMNEVLLRQLSDYAYGYMGAILRNKLGRYSPFVPYIMRAWKKESVSSAKMDENSDQSVFEAFEKNATVDLQATADANDGTITNAQLHELANSIMGTSFAKGRMFVFDKEDVLFHLGIMRDKISKPKYKFADIQTELQDGLAENSYESAEEATKDVEGMEDLTDAQRTALNTLIDEHEFPATPEEIEEMPDVDAEENPTISPEGVESEQVDPELPVDSMSPETPEATTTPQIDPAPIGGDETTGGASNIIEKARRESKMRATKPHGKQTVAPNDFSSPQNRDALTVHIRDNIIQVEGGWNPDDPNTITPKEPGSYAGITQGAWVEFHKQFSVFPVVKRLKKVSDLHELAKNTETAQEAQMLVKAFYNSFIPKTGGASVPYWAALPIIDFGINSGPGAVVKELQKWINARDKAAKLKVDGIWGSETQEKVLEKLEQITTPERRKKFIDWIFNKRMKYVKTVGKKQKDGLMERVKKMKEEAYVLAGVTDSAKKPEVLGMTPKPKTGATITGRGGIL